MIWLPTLELLLQLLAVLLCLTAGVHLIGTVILLQEYFIYDEPLTKSNRDWIWRTKWWVIVLVMSIMVQKFFRDNNVPLEMFPWINSSQKIHHVHKS